jgi:hypothetical protein
VTWTKLSANKEAQRHKTSKNELDNMRALIARDLADAGITGLSADRRFATACNAALQAGRRAPTRKLKQSGGFRKSLQGVQERQQIGGVCAVQIPVKSTHLSRFAAMHADGAINRCRAIVMGQSSGLREDVG